MLKDQIDDLFGMKPQPPEPDNCKADGAPQTIVHNRAEPEVPENEFDPEGPLDPEAIPTEPDSFTQMLTEMLEAEGVDVKLETRRRYDPAKGNTSSHEWETQRERMFANEPYQFRCKRCLKWVEVASDETVLDALQRTGVDPNCASQVLTDIMEA